MPQKKELEPNFAPKPKKESAIRLSGTLSCIFFLFPRTPTTCLRPFQEVQTRQKTSLRFFFNLTSSVSHFTKLVKS